MCVAAMSGNIAIPSFLKTRECLFPLKSMQYPSIKSAISSALASENVVNTRGCKQEGDKNIVTCNVVAKKFNFPAEN